MAVTDAPVAKIDADSMIPEVWTPIVNEENFAKAIISNFVTDLSQYIAAGGDTIHVPDAFTNSFTGQTQSTEGAEVVTESPATVDVTITVNTHSYVAWLLGDKTMMQIATIYDLNEVYARKAQGTIMYVLEDALFGLWSSLTTTAVGDTSNGLTDADIRTAISTMAEADFDVRELAFFVHPEVFYKQLMGISKYYTDDTANLDVIRTGNFGPVVDTGRGLVGALYGRPIFSSTRVVNSLQTYRNMLLHPDAFGFGILNQGTLPEEFGGGPMRIRVQSEYELRNIGQLVVVDMVHGSGVLRADAGVVLNSSNNFITS